MSCCQTCSKACRPPDWLDNCVTTVMSLSMTLKAALFVAISLMFASSPPTNTHPQ